MPSTQKPVLSEAIVLAAGRGTRLRPYTDTLPKPLLPINGRPTLDLLFESLALAGITNVCAVTHHLEEQITTYLNNQQWIANTRTAHQDIMNGTAPAVLTALDTEIESSVLVTATDYLVSREFYREFLEFHASHDGDISISLKAVPKDELSKRSSVRFDSHDNIVEVVEKPDDGTAPSQYSANLLFVLPPGFRRYLIDVKASVRGELEIQDAINQFLSTGGTARGLLQNTPHEWQPELL